MRRQVEQLAGHHHGELVGLQLLRDHRPPDRLPALLLLGRGARARLRDRRELAPGEVADLPFLLLRQLVEAEDATRVVVVRCIRGGLALRLDQRLVRGLRVDRLVGRLDGHRRIIAVQRSPPRSWWARKKFSDPAVAIAEEAEISSASAAAATIWAKRCTLPVPAQPSRASHERA